MLNLFVKFVMGSLESLLTVHFRNFELKIIDNNYIVFLTPFSCFNQIWNINNFKFKKVSIEGNLWIRDLFLSLGNK